MAIDNYFNNPESRFQQGAALLTAMNLDLNINNPHADRFRLAIAEILEAGWDAKLWELENPADDKVTVEDHFWMKTQAREMQRGIFTDEQRQAEVDRVEADLLQREEDGEAAS